MKGNTLFTLLILLVLSCASAFAQQTVDMVTMKDGKVFTGKILHYEPGKILKLEKEDGSSVELTDEEIAKIQQGMEVKNKVIPQSVVMETPIAKTRGFYTSSMLSFAAGDSEGDLSLGAGFSQAFGYHFYPAIGLGFGLGVDNYSRRGETLYPVFAELRTLLPSKKQTGNFYGLANAGFAVGFPRDHLDIIKAQGGFMGYAAFGYRTATMEGLDIYVDLGLKYQQAHFERSLYNGDLEVRDVDFRRLVIRVGLGFWK